MISIPVTMETGGVATGVEQIKAQVGSLKSGQVAGTFKALAQDLAMANSPAEMLAATMNRLTLALKGTIFGAAALAIGKLLAAPFEQLSTIVLDTTNRAKSAISSVSKEGANLTFDQAVSQAQSLKSAIDEIDTAVQKINSNPFLRMADAIIGASKELKALQETLRLISASNLSMGALVDAENAEEMVGKSDREKRLLRIDQEADAKRRKAQDEIPGTGINLDSVLADIERERAAKKKDIEVSEEQKAREGALRATEQIAKIEEKIRQSRLTGPQLAEELIAKYQQLIGMQKMFESFGTAESAEQAAQFGLEAAQIKEQLAGMGQKGGGGLEVLSDSLQQVGGGGRYAQIGAEKSVDYLKRLDDTNKKQLDALVTISKNTSQSSTEGVT